MGTGEEMKSQPMSKEEFQKQMEIAKSIVESWPPWAQNLLEAYASPTVAVPRKPVVTDD